MPIVLLYLLKLSISLAIVWLFYQLLLRRLTFYKWNRWYLLGYSLIAFFIPLINIGSMIPDNDTREPLVIQFIPMIGNYTPAEAHGWSFAWNTWNIVLTVLLLGAASLLIRTVIRWSSLIKFRAQARLMDHPEVRVYQVDEKIIPFSFGNAIYINPRLHTEKEWRDIILHEYVHVRQRHTVDILLAELICILNWYNPFAWLIRFSLRQNLEFIADQQVLENGVDKKGYQYHLLKVIGEPAYRMANNFNFSSLKKRIIMMNTIRSARLHLVKFLFILPLIAVLLVAFRDRYTAVTDARGAAEKVISTPKEVVKVPVKPEMPSHTGTMARPVVNRPVPAVGGGGKSEGRARTADYRTAYRTDTVPANTDASLKGPVLERVTVANLRKALYVIDGVRMPADWQVEKINPVDIYSMEIFKGASAMQLYGRDAENGVIVITTNSFHTELAKKPIDPLHPPTQEPLYIIDGVEMSHDALNGIDPKRIRSISVLTKQSAIATYGDKAKGGVVLVSLKPAGEVAPKDSSNMIHIQVRPDTLRRRP